MQHEYSKNIGRTFQGFAMCGASAFTIYHQSISCAAGSPARTLAMLESDLESPDQDQGFGPNTTESFASLDRASLSWKTSQHSWIEELTRYSATWPRAGMMRNGRCYRRALWVRHTHAKECSLWPTPTASMGKRGWGLSRTGRLRYSAETTQRVLESGYIPHPDFLEDIMGFPIGWSALDD